MNEQNNPSSAKLKVRQAANHYKSVLETARLAYANKAKESITYQKLGSHDFWQIVYSGLNEAKFAIPPLFNGPEEFFSAFDIKQSCLLKTFLRALILMTQVYLYLFYLLKLIWKCAYSCNSHVGYKGHNHLWFIKGVQSWLYSSGGFKEVWAWIFIHTSWTLQYASKGILFCWKVSSVVRAYNKNVGRFVDHVEGYVFFFDFKYGLRSSWSTTDLLTVVSDRTVRAIQSSWVTRAVVFWYIQDFQQGVACRSSSKLKS